VSTGIKGTLDHPFFGPGHTDNRASTLVADGISELSIGVNIRSQVQLTGTNLVIVAVVNQSMFGVN
jgi:hypothetical protein